MLPQHRSHHLLVQSQQWKHQNNKLTYSKLTIKTSEQRQQHQSSVFIVNFEHIQHIFLLFLITLKKHYLSATSLNCFRHSFDKYAKSPESRRIPTAL